MTFSTVGQRIFHIVTMIIDQHISAKSELGDQEINNT